MVGRARRAIGVVAAAAGFLLVSACAAAQQTSPPAFAHVVVVVEENHSYADIIGNRHADFLNQVSLSGALFTNAYGVEHPSQPNYLDLFSGGNQGVTNDSCPHTFDTPNLGASLLAAGKSFAGYSEDLPYAGYNGCASGTYRRKHNPWVDFSNLPDRVNLPMNAFPSDFSQLPTVSFVVPGLETDMHDGTIDGADDWLRANLASYLDWARLHNSLLVITWDESEGDAGNHIPLIIAGAHVRTGLYGERVDHYSLLRTIEEMYGLAPIGASAAAMPIGAIWK